MNKDLEELRKWRDWVERITKSKKYTSAQKVELIRASLKDAYV